MSLWKVYCGKTADWIQMPFGVLSGVGQGMGVLDGVVIVEREGAVLDVNLGRPTQAVVPFNFSAVVAPIRDETPGAVLGKNIGGGLVPHHLGGSNG